MALSFAMIWAEKSAEYSTVAIISLGGRIGVSKTTVIDQRFPPAKLA